MKSSGYGAIWAAETTTSRSRISTVSSKTQVGEQFIFRNLLDFVFLICFSHSKNHWIWTKTRKNYWEIRKNFRKYGKIEETA